ncbi:MAG: DUF5666 domain-containing protein [Chloroflexi bacterium]|nr:DUF5666 domain-containing protein [Chloroflexota bacterium]
METSNRRDRRRALRVGAATAALAATMLTGAVVSAQSPSTAPTDTQTTPTVPAAPVNMRANGGPNGGRGEGGARGEMGGPGQGFGGEPGGRGGMVGMGRDVTVTANDGLSLTLETADGWSRTIDTTGVVLTEGTTAISVTDIAVGDDIGIAQTRNADGSFTVTGIAVLPASVRGTVATVGTDSFTVTVADGTTQTMNVTATTTWDVRASTAPGIVDLTAGRQVSVRGSLAADGSLDAAKVAAR